MGKIIATCNQKGGVGKTTTTVNLAAYLATSGKKILLIDTDPQGNATSGIGFEKHSITSCLYNALIEGEPLKNIIKETNINNLDLIPATSQLAGAEVELVNAANRETKLKTALQDIKDLYDFILIDCPPSLSLLTVNALTAADEVIIPIQCEYYALEGLGRLTETIHLIRESLNPNLKIRGILFTMFDGRTILSNQVVEETKNHFKDEVFRTIIPRNIRLAEAPSYGQPILLYDPTSTGATAYESLAKEINQVVPTA